MSDRSVEEDRSGPLSVQEGHEGLREECSESHIKFVRHRLEVIDLGACEGVLRPCVRSCTYVAF